VSRFQFVDDHRDTVPVKWLCQMGPSRPSVQDVLIQGGTPLFSGQPLWMVFGRSLTLAPYASVNCPPAGTWHPFVLGT
jgi:hypothetical protein